MLQRQPKVSVIIPVYKAEIYIEKCVRTLFGQTLVDMEYIFVDDCTPDKSIEIIQSVLIEFPERRNQVIIIKNEKNLGVGQTRQRGIDAASGKYIIHCDPDDWIELDMYEAMYNRAKDTDSDIVICDYSEIYSNYSKVIEQPLSESKKDRFHHIAVGPIHCSFWNKLVKASLAKSVKIKSGINHWEDLSVIAFLLIKCNAIVRITSSLYNYNMSNMTSMSHTNIIDRALSTISAVRALENQLSISGLMVDVDVTDMNRLKWRSKFGLLSVPSKKNVNLWIMTFPETNNSYRLLGLTKKDNFLSFCALHKLYFLIFICNQLSGSNIIKKLKNLIFNGGILHN